MPAMANITVKKFDGTTDIVFDALSGSSGGDTSPAVWRQDTGNTAALPNGLRPMFMLWGKANGSKTARQIKFTLVFPYATQDSTTTRYSSNDRVVFEGIITVPQAVPLLNVNEAVHQGLNLLASSLTKSSAISGYAPT